MESTKKPYCVYIKTNSSGYITAVNSSAFLSDVTGWMQIDSGYGDKYHHAQGNYFPRCIVTARGGYRYKLVEGMLEECSEEEVTEQMKNEDISENLSLEARVNTLENSYKEIRKMLALVGRKSAS